MERLVGVVGLVGMLLCVGSGAEPAAARGGGTPSLALLLPGVYHGDEVSARTGERWLGLFAGRNSELKSMPVRVSRLRDELVDEAGDRPTGKEVGTQGKAQALFFLRGSGAPAPGPVTTVYQGDPERGLGNGQQLPLRLGSTRYVLRVVSRSRKGDFLAPDARLVLSNGKRAQVLYRPTDWGGEARSGPVAVTEWRVPWAGDLDRDGRLDLLVAVTWHYNLSQRMLFLSSAAAPGQLLRRVARFEAVGC